MQINLNARIVVLQTLPKNSVGIEIGVHLGDFSAQILANATPNKLYLIDPYLHFEDASYAKAWYGGSAAGQQEMDERFERVQNRFRTQIENGRVELVREKSVLAASRFADESLDFVYIDGDHTFDGVWGDIKAYFPKLKIGGLLIGDDYSLGSWWGSGVVDAFHNALNVYPMRIEFAMDNQICCRRVVKN